MTEGTDNEDTTRTPNRWRSVRLGRFFRSFSNVASPRISRARSASAHAHVSCSAKDVENVATGVEQTIGEHDVVKRGDRKTLTRSRRIAVYDRDNSNNVDDKNNHNNNNNNDNSNINSKDKNNNNNNIDDNQDSINDNDNNSSNNNNNINNNQDKNKGYNNNKNNNNNNDKNNNKNNSKRCECVRETSDGRRRVGVKSDHYDVVLLLGDSQTPRSVQEDIKEATFELDARKQCTQRRGALVWQYTF